MFKRGQSATGATMLILIVLIIFIVLSAVSNPEQLRGVLSGNVSKVGVFKEYVIGVLVEDADDATKNIPGFGLDSLSNTNVLARFPDVSPSNGFFKRNAQTKNFNIASPEMTDSVYLSFTATERKGTLVIVFNDNVLFTGELSKANNDPLRIPSQYLKKYNTLVFSTESGFLSSGEYVLKDVAIIGTVKDVSPLTKKVSFSLEFEEHSTLLSANLKYTPTCDEESAPAIVVVKVNNHVAQNGTIVCGEEYTSLIPKTGLKNGVNSLTFSSSSKVRIDDISIVPVMSISKKFATTFQAAAIPKRLLLELDLPDSGEKSFIVTVNDKDFSMMTDRRFEIIDITNSTIVGTNYLEISPHGTVTVSKARLKIG